jgi:hypothetical protein
MTATLHAPIAPGTDLREVFRTTYENRYTWSLRLAAGRSPC